MKLQAAPDKPDWRNDLVLAAGAVLVLLAVGACAGFPTLADARGDNDSLLRLVEVRDLLAGQAWFDLHQYRMGPAGGFAMHWSRLVDGPLAVLVLAGQAVTGSREAAEAVVRVLWPSLLYGLTVFFLVRAARRFGGEAATLPAAVIGGTSLFFLGIYTPGALDHHNVQLMLTVAAVSLLLDAPRWQPAAALAGCCMALTLAVGMETAPYVAVIGSTVAGLLILDPEGERAVARRFGLGFAGAGAAAFAGTVPPAAWGDAACDAYSAAQFLPAAAGGIGLAAVTFLPFPTGRLRLLAALGLLGTLVAAIVLVLFPQCLAAPYAGVDARLHALWLDQIAEAQSLRQLLAEDPASVVARYVTPVLGLLLALRRLRRHPRSRRDVLVAAVLAAAVLVSVWQVRGSVFSIPLATIPLAAWVGVWRERAGAQARVRTVVRMLAVWLVSTNLVWSSAAAAATVLLDLEAAPQQVLGSPCEARRDFAGLAALPPTTVLAVSNLGSPILAYTGHRSLAGPYHRNAGGNLAALDAFVGPADDAERVVRRHHIGLVALCPGNAESRVLSLEAPQGFLAGLMRGTVPAWLEPVAGTDGQPLRLYRVLPHA